jgi:Outer membrane protein beta-barrel domain
MKNIYLLFSLLLICPNISFSQSYLHSGLYNISGSATFFYTGNDQDAINKFSEIKISIAPTISYFFIDRLSTGIEISYNYDEKNYQPVGSYPDINLYITFGTVLKYYFLDNNISPFVKAGYLHSLYNITVPYNRNRKSFPGYSAELGLGLNYFFSESFSAETSLEYVYSQKKLAIYEFNSVDLKYSFEKTLRLNISLLYFL